MGLCATATSGGFSLKAIFNPLHCLPDTFCIPGTVILIDTLTASLVEPSIIADAKIAPNPTA
jgi:hypothetical protein